MFRKGRTLKAGSDQSSYFQTQKQDSTAGFRAIRGAMAAGSDPVKAVATQGNPGRGARALFQDLASIEGDLAGVGLELQKLLEDPQVTDVLINAPDQIWVDSGDGMQKKSLNLGSASNQKALAVRMAAACGRRLDDACPIVDGTLPDGTRLHAVLPPISGSGVSISLRTRRARAFTLSDLVAAGTVPASLVPIFEALVKQRANTIISGATGSGKTTLLATILGMISSQQRIICIEEVMELSPNHPHVVHLQERRPNVQNAGKIELADLVRAAMRMRPDRLVLGECRGGEVREVLAALNTGHEGGWATVHANAATDVPARLVALGSLAGMTPATVAAQASSALDAIVHIRRASSAGISGGKRMISQIAVPERRGAELVCPVAIQVERTGDIKPGPAWPELRSRLELAADFPC